jgi:hypothetical protein
MFWLLAVSCAIAMTAMMVVDELDWEVRLRERQMIPWDD